jgi:hypothetical protein
MNKEDLDKLTIADLVAMRQYLQNNYSTVFGHNYNSGEKTQTTLDWIDSKLKDKIYNIWLEIQNNGK